MARKVVVTGRFSSADGVPLRGSVTFTPSQWVNDISTGRAVAVSQVVVPLNVHGAISKPLTATTGPDVDPTGWSWSVVEEFHGVKNRPAYTIVLPYDTPDGTVDLNGLVPVDTEDPGPIVLGPLVYDGGEAA